MVKFLFFTFLVLWLAYKLAGFALRLVFGQGAFRVYSNGQRPQGNPQQQAAKPQASDSPKHVTDSLGDYVDFEEVK